MSGAGTEVSGEVAEVPALSISQATLETKLARDAFLDAIAHWREYTPREVGELGERWWKALRARHDAIVEGES